VTNSKEKVTIKPFEVKVKRFKSQKTP